MQEKLSEVKCIQNQIADHPLSPHSTATPLSVYNEIVNIIIDHKLTFQLNTEHIFSKSKQRLCDPQVQQSILAAFYECFIEPILTFNITAWFGSLTLTHHNTLNKIIRICRKIIGQEPQSLSTIFNTRVMMKGNQIASDHSRTLNNHYTLLPSGRRYRSLPQWKKNAPPSVCLTAV